MDITFQRNLVKYFKSSSLTLGDKWYIVHTYLAHPTGILNAKIF